jgi:hypothetical protein
MGITFERESNFCNIFCKREEQNKCSHYPFDMGSGAYDCCPHKMSRGISGSSGIIKKNQFSTRRQFQKRKNFDG